MSTINTLTDLYKESLKDIYNANKQSKAATEKLHGAAHSPELKKALEAGVQGIQKGIDALDKIADKHGFKPTGKVCKGMEGLVTEAEEHGIKASYGDGDVQDAMIIQQYQRMVHYALVGYGSLLAYAKRLGLDEDAKILQKCLDDTYDGDRHMTEIATGSGGINAEAAA